MKTSLRRTPEPARRCAMLALLVVLVGTMPVSAQSGAEFLEIVPGEVENFSLYCVDAYGRIVANCCMMFSNGYYLGSGGHLHNQARPSSVVSVSSYCYNLYHGVVLQIDARHGVGQWEYLNICSQSCYTCPFYCNFTDVWIRHWPLYDLYGGGVPPYSRPIGAQPGYHLDNHFGTNLLAYAVDQITQQYYGEFYCVPDAQGIKGYRPVGVNDMALEGGGVFDVKAPSGPSYAWKPPHLWHSAGNSVDFRCKPNQENSIIYVDQVIRRFMEICDIHGLKYQRREDPGLSNEHVHCGVRAGN